MSFKVGCKTTDNEPWTYSAIRFATTGEAQEYAQDLYSRWMSLKAYEIHDSEDDANYAWKDGTYSRLGGE